MPNPAVDLTDLNTLKAWLSITDSSADAALDALITRASDYLAQQCSRTFVAQEFTETRNGNGKSTLVLRNRPIISVRSLTIDGVAIPVSPGPNRYGYVVSQKAIYLVGGVFSRGAVYGSYQPYDFLAYTPGYGNVTVIYTAGYATVPPAVSQACIDLCAWWWKGRAHIGQATQALQGVQTASFSLADAPSTVVQMIEQYSDFVPAID